MNWRKFYINQFAFDISEYSQKTQKTQKKNRKISSMACKVTINIIYIELFLIIETLLYYNSKLSTI